MPVKQSSFAFYIFLAIAVLGCSTNPTAQSLDRSGVAAASAPAPNINPAETGSISGTVTLDGAPPPVRRIDMDSEPVCRQMHPKPVDFPEVVVGDHGALANAVVYVRSGLGNYHFDPPHQAAILDQKGCMYDPHVVALMANQPLEIVNSDATLHNVHPTPRINPGWNQSQISATAPIEKRFAKPELAIPVMCNVHPWMRGYIFVFGNPYFAVTPSSGTFELPNLPAGTYTIEAWQEKYGTLDQTVTIAAGESKAIRFTFHGTAR